MVSGIMVFEKLSWYWEQTLTIFEDILLEKSACATGTPY